MLVGAARFTNSEFRRRWYVQSVFAAELLEFAAQIRSSESTFSQMQISKGMRCTPFDIWSERRDLNSRPPGPEPGALPSCATPRVFCWKAAYDLEPAKANSYRPNRAGMNWSQCRDSNPGPAHYECAALPTELHWLAQLFIITPNAALVTTSMPRKAEIQGIYFWRGIDPNAASWFIL